MELNDGSSVMDRLDKLEGALRTHQATVARRVKADIERKISLSETNHRLLFHQFSRDLLKLVTAQHADIKLSLDQVEDRLINTKSVQIGLMEARMVMNTQEALMQIEASVSKFARDIHEEFLVLKRGMKAKRTEKGRGKAKSNNCVRKKKKKHVKELFQVKHASVNVKKATEAPLVSFSNNDEDEKAFIEKRTLPEFDSDFLDLMKDADIVPENVVEAHHDQNELDYSLAPMMPEALNGTIDDASKIVGTVSVKIEERTEEFKKVAGKETIGTNNMEIPAVYATVSPLKSTVRKLPPVCPQMSSKCSSRKRPKMASTIHVIPLEKLLPTSTSEHNDEILEVLALQNP